MKVLKPIHVTKIPSRTAGNGSRASSNLYDAIAKRITNLSRGNVLPIECESVDECLRLDHALKVRGCTSIRRKNIVYVGR